MLKIELFEIPLTSNSSPNTALPPEERCGSLIEEEEEKVFEDE